MPTTQPIQNGQRDPPGASYFSWTAPKKIIAALAAKMAMRAAMSLMPGDHRDEHDHHGRRERVLRPPEVVVLAREAGDVPPEDARRGDQPVEAGGQEQEERDTPGDRDVEQGGRRACRGAGRACHECRGHRQGEGGREGQDGDPLDRMEQPMPMFHRRRERATDAWESTVGGGGWRRWRACRSFMERGRARRTRPHLGV